jgi:ubiquinone/menaquinone biosynthesis C-methylase UbiE
VERFSGFADIYDLHRPEAPRKVVEMITAYLERRPSVVVDLGSGTGLSAMLWKNDADNIIGVEPNDDMRGRAERKAAGLDDAQHIRFVKGYSDQLDLADGSVDVITCSQSFHWMDPQRTLREAARVLKEGGIFAAYDCDWPPTIHWRIEEAYRKLIAMADERIAQLADPQQIARKRDKEEHLEQIRASGFFRFAKEIVFHKTEWFDAERFVGLALSQGGIQTVFKLGSGELDAEIESFKALVERHFLGRSLEALLSYRMRLGVK